MHGSTYLKNTTRYWRNSLADAEHLSPSSSLLKEAPGISFEEYRAGRVSRNLLERLFKKGDVENEIEVFIYPLTFHYHKQVEHGTAPSYVSTFYASLAINALLDRKGHLHPNGKNFPIICRNLLFPSGTPITIGTIESADAFYNQNTESLNSWADVCAYAAGLIEKVSESTEEALTLTDCNKLPGGRIIRANQIKASQHIIRLYDQLADKSLPPLLCRLINGISEEPMLSFAAQCKTLQEHTAQMNPEYGLSRTQREALAHFLSAWEREGEITAINGPPGTGKTTLLQSVVATLWTQAALRREQCPIIVATSSNNQAVTNILDSFTKINGADDVLAERWIPNFKVFGTYLTNPTENDPKKKSKKSDYLLLHAFLERFEKKIETDIGFHEAEQYFLQKFATAFPKTDSITDLASAREFLHAALVETTQQTNRILNHVMGLMSEHSKEDWSLEFGQQVLKKLTLEASEAHTEARDTGLKLEALRKLKQQWNEHQCKEPLWISLLHFLPFVKEKRKQRDAAFYLKNNLDREIGNSEEKLSRNLLDSRIESLHSDCIRSNEAAMLKLLQCIADKDRYAAQWIPLQAWCNEHRIKGDLPSILEQLDKGPRYSAFQLATHYWEAEYLLEVQERQLNSTKDNLGPTKLLSKYRRVAKLTPCFVSTFFMLPEFFSGWKFKEDRSSDWDKVPLLNQIDLLIVDEAGQTSPEVGGASFSLAKRALVVGDTWQIEPVSKIPFALDCANAKRFSLLDQKPYSSFIESGGAATAGSIMALAQKACRFTAKPNIARGLFLAEHRRCYNDIIAYCNRLVYGGQLQPCRGFAPNSNPLPSLGYAHIESLDLICNGSRSNRKEAEIIISWIKERRPQLEDFYQKPIHDILGIITPFSTQAKLLQKLLAKQSQKTKASVPSQQAQCMRFKVQNER